MLLLAAGGVGAVALLLRKGDEEEPTEGGAAPTNGADPIAYAPAPAFWGPTVARPVRTATITVPGVSFGVDPARTLKAQLEGMRAAMFGCVANLRPTNPDRDRLWTETEQAATVARMEMLLADCAASKAQHTGSNKHCYDAIDSDCHPLRLIPFPFGEIAYNQCFDDGLQDCYEAYGSKL